MHTDGGINRVMSTFFYFKKALTNCPPLPGVESLPLVLMLYILAFSDQFGGPSGHDSTSASSWSNFPSMLAGEAVWDRSLTFGWVVFALSPPPLQRFQRTGPFFGLVLNCKTDEG